MKSATTTKRSLTEIRSLVAKGKSQSVADAPPADDDLPDRFWTDAVKTRRRPAKQSVHLRVDADVLAWFKSQGNGHLTLMNDVLKAYATAKGAKVG